MRIDRDEVLVDIGSKSEGTIPAHEMRDPRGNPTETLHIGETIWSMCFNQKTRMGM